MRTILAGELSVPFKPTLVAVLALGVLWLIWAAWHYAGKWPGRRRPRRG